jgi:hypothetical protein
LKNTKNLENERRNSTKLKLAVVSNLSPLNAMKEQKKECLDDNFLLNEENLPPQVHSRWLRNPHLINGLCSAESGISWTTLVLTVMLYSNVDKMKGGVSWAS